MPAAIAGAAGGLALAFLLIGMLLIYGFARTSLYSARGSAQGIPLAGGFIANAITGLINWLEWSVDYMASWFDTQLWWIVSHLRHFALVSTKPITDAISIGITGLWSWINWLYGSINSLYATVLPYVYGKLATLSDGLDWQFRTINPNLYSWVTWLYSAETRTANQVEYVVTTQVPDIYGQIAKLDVRVAALESGLTSLLPYLPILQKLAQFESSTALGLQGLNDLARQGEQDLLGIKANLNTLTGLAALAGLSALEYAALRTLARNPCYCLTDGPFNDIPDRVEALENFGS